MNHEVYLEKVIKSLDEAIIKLEEKLDFREKEIAKIKEYYWENYREYDEYGYELTDDNRTLKEEEDAHEALFNKYKRYNKMKNSPYFAAVTFKYDGEDEEENYYIGIGDFSPKLGLEPLVCDWRAPISGLFYDYDPGKASIHTKEGEIKGELMGKYQFKIKDGKLLYAIDSHIVINDEILQKELSMNADARLKSIVSTIQKEQNEIIRNEKDKILIIQGAAGSGKTSIALHRMAYLLYHNRKNLSSRQILILSPNPAFSNYISHILPELGEENILEMTFDIYAYKELSEYGEAQDKYMYIENLQKLDEILIEDWDRRYEYKHSRKFVEEINKYVLELEDEIMNFKAISYKKVKKEANELMVFFYEKFPDIPLFERMKAIAEYIIDEADTENGGGMDEFDINIVEERLTEMYETKNIFTLYNRFLISRGFDEIGSESGVIPYEDVFPMLYLKFMLYGFRQRAGIKHLIVDEMQDYSYIELFIISKMFNCHMTILGDINQSMMPDKKDTLSICKEVFGKDAKVLKLLKSYRSTKEITEFANKIAGIEGNEIFDRHGNKPGIFNVTSEEEMALKIIENINSESKMNFDTTAIITKTFDEAKTLYEFIKAKGVNITLLDSDSDTIEPGIIAAPFYLAKGLEFDSVHIAYVNKIEYYSKYHRNILYISATRALHELNFYGFGEISDLLVQ